MAFMSPEHVEHRLIGPPGTGKTTTLASKIRGTVKKYGPGSVCVASFTKAAAAEIAGRDLGADAYGVGTLHSLCFRALGAPVMAAGLTSEWNEACPPDLRLSAVAGRTGGQGDAVVADDAIGGTDGDPLMSQLDLLRSLRVPASRWPADVARFARAWEAWKTERDALDFTDLIETAIRVRARPPGSPRFGFFDEVQDWGRLEFTLVRQWCEDLEGSLWAGDPDQTLYSWRGATPDSFYDPPIPDERWSVLDQSYRVSRAVHRTAMDWIDRDPVRRRVSYKPTEEDGTSTESADVNVFDGESMVDLVRSMQTDGRTVMVLASCAYMLDPFIRAARDRGVTFHNPYRTANGKWNPMRGGVERLRSFLQPIDPAAGWEDPRPWTYRELWRWVDLLKARGTIVRGMKSTVQATARENPDQLAGDEDLRAIFEADAYAELTAAIKSRTAADWLFGNLAPSKLGIMEFARNTMTNGGRSAIEVDPTCIVGTIHSVKGGEADSVILAPDLSPSSYEGWLDGGETAASVRRAMYVGMTRARSDLVLLAPRRQRAVEWNE